MKKLIVAFVISMSFVFGDPNIVFVKIMIVEDANCALIEVKGGYKVYNQQNNKILSSGFKEKKHYLEVDKKGLRWGELYSGIHQIKISPNNENTTILVNGIECKGSIEIYEINSKIQLINELDAEDFLKSMISVNLDSLDHNNATLESIAIAARTNLYYTITNSTNNYWHINASKSNCIVDKISSIDYKINKAVNATKNSVMTYNGKTFPTTWTINCAGHTANYQSIFRKKNEGPNGVLVSYAKKERNQNQWECELSNEEIAKKLHTSIIRSIELYCDQNTKKTYGLRLNDGEKIIDITFLKFQELIGKQQILSNDMSVHLAKDSVLFTGYGEGHGVGLCLFSADQMAKYGLSANQILQNFYQETELVKLNTIKNKE